MDDVALLSATERAEIFQQTAAQKSISSAIAMEKDFWVCWILRRIFDPPLIEGMVFKGGTSLSKVYKAIARFSEDVDLSIPREALGFSGTHDLTPGISRTRQDHLLTDMRDACERHVSGRLRESLTARITAALASGLTPTWSLDVADSDAGTLLFGYPPALPAETYGAGGYIRPIIRLEFGGRNEVWPAEVHRVRPYCLEEFPTLSENPACDVNVLAAERTFWEKATLVHAEYHRPESNRRPERVSRHYSDLARLTQSDVGTRAIEQLELLRAVAEHKARYFPSRWARYDEALRGNLHVIPHDRLVEELRFDYAQMREMFFEEPEPFDAMLEALRQLEVRVNELTAKLDAR
jgi:hypothetical protein